MNNDKNKRIEEILGSLDGAPKAEMPSFFYTRLKARMQAGEEKAMEGSSPQKSWFLRPAFALTALVTVLAINAFVLFQKADKQDSNTGDPDSSIQTIAAEYSLNDNSTALFETNQDK